MARRNGKMTINKFRSYLYLTAKLLGDVQAVRSKKPGAVQKRIARRMAGKATGRFLGSLFK